MPRGSLVYFQKAMQDACSYPLHQNRHRSAASCCKLVVKTLQTFSKALCCHCSLSRSSSGSVTGVAVAATTLILFDVAAHALLSGSCHACRTVNWGLNVHMCPDTISSLKSTSDAATRCMLQRFSFFQGSALSAFPQPTRSGNLGKAGPITSETMENLWTWHCLLKGPRFAVAQVHLDVRPRRRCRSDKNLLHRQSFARTVTCESPARMQLCAVRCTCGLQDAVVALIQPTSILDPSSGVHCFRCPNGKSAGTSHAIKCSTKLVISDKTCRLEPGLLPRKTSQRLWVGFANIHGSNRRFLASIAT